MTLWYLFPDDALTPAVTETVERGSRQALWWNTKSQNPLTFKVSCK